MKNLTIASTIGASMILFVVCSCCKQPAQTTPTRWRTEYIRDTSTALCQRITNADSAIVYMDHLFVPLYSEKGIQFNNPLGQSAFVWIPGVASQKCIVLNYYCPEYLVGRDVEIAFALFSHPSQLQEWKDLSADFTKQGKEWSLSLQFTNIYCRRLGGLKIKNGKIIWAQ